MLLNVYNRYPVNFVRGEGLYLYDDKGEEYLDFVSGIAVNGLGHCHPKMVKAIETQAKKLLHVSNLYHNKAQEILANNLVSKTAFERVFFCNSGAEANELALKIARKHGKKVMRAQKDKRVSKLDNKLENKSGDESEGKPFNKDIILYMHHSFHGRTTGTLAVTGQVQYQKDFMPLMPRTVACEFNNLEELRQNFSEEVCGIILEPIQGEGGLASANLDYLREVRKLCDEYNALLIFDEIQCGMGRTGSLFVCERLEVLPDVITLAKALGGGLPIGACMTRGKANQVLEPGDHGSTYGGNPFVTHVANVILEELTTGGVIDHVREIAPYAAYQLSELKEKYPTLLTELLGEGLLLGFRLSENLKAADFVKKALENKLLLVPAGGNVVRYFPALIVTKKEIDESMDILDKLFSHFL